MKKFISYIFALLLIIPCAIFCTACGKNPAEEVQPKVMNLSANPKLELILDTNNKVVTVNALNDEGNRIITVVSESSLSFENLTPEQAAELFFKVTEQLGYLGTEVTISITGDSTNLLASVKATVNKYFEENNINVNVLTEKLAKSQLVKEVAKAMQEYSQAMLNNMSEKDLIKLLESSRKETAKFLTQELKDAYYELREEVIKQAKFEALKQFVSSIPGFDSTIIADIEKELTENFEPVIESLKSNLKKQLLDSTQGEYYTKMQAYLKAKQDVLNKKLDIDATLTQSLAYYEELASQAKQALQTAKEIAFDAIDDIKDGLTQTTDELNMLYNNSMAFIKVLPNFDLTSFNNLIAEKIETFKTNFETDFAEYLNKSHWSTTND